MKTITVKLTQNQIKELKERYAKLPMRFDIQYTHYQIKGSDFTITAYTSGKVVFSGEGAEYHASPYTDGKTECKSSSQTISSPQAVFHAGSDEVGTGDYFGPITVCAALVTEENMKRLPIHEIMDTKQMKDEVILQIAPKIMDEITYSLLVLQNQRYNIIHQTMNLNVIKAKLHNQAYLHLAEKAKVMPDLAVVDQFMPENRYYEALVNEKEVYRKLHFETKAENKYLAVACGAIIARYAFLKAYEQLEETYGVTFPKGAGAHVDTFGQALVKEHGPEILEKVAKYHFSNTQRIIHHD